MLDDLGVPTSTSDLAARPGFLIRRLHQIHLALFAEECSAFNVTTVQYSIMTVAAARPGLDQMALAYEVGVDRATLANVVARLETRGLLRRTRGRTDRRLKNVTLTAAGRTLLGHMAEAAHRAHERTVEALPPDERAAFLHALRQLVDVGNEYGRAPFRLAQTPLSRTVAGLDFPTHDPASPAPRGIACDGANGTPQF
jgi:MarR family transcriptional regulator, lower aerobic nicotinate degradation pathway regulator